VAAKFSQNWNKWIDKVLKGTHNHYSCYLPKKLGVIATLILKLFYSGIKTLRAILNTCFITSDTSKSIFRIRKLVLIIASTYGSPFPV
jgi:hypothetical protein